MIRSLTVKFAMLLCTALAVGAIFWHAPTAPVDRDTGPVSPEPIVIEVTPRDDGPVQHRASHGEATVVPAATTDLVPPPGRSMKESRPGMPASTQGVGSAKLDLNRATQQDFERLPGIGPALARQLVAYRTAHGAYTSVSDLRAVKGIGAKRYQRLAPLVTVVGDSRPPVHPPRRVKEPRRS